MIRRSLNIDKIRENNTSFLIIQLCHLNRIFIEYNVSVKKQGISKPEFYGALVYRIRKIVGKSCFSEQFRKLINRYKRILECVFVYIDL